MFILFIIITLIAAIIGYFIGVYVIAPALARKHLEHIKQEVFMAQLEWLAVNGKAMNPEIKK